MVKIANLALVVFQLFVQYSSGRNIHRRTNRQRREVFWWMDKWRFDKN